MARSETPAALAAVDESVPSQQGLKPDLDELVDVVVLVDESVPSQQGLKHSLVVTVLGAFGGR